MAAKTSKKTTSRSGTRTRKRTTSPRRATSTARRGAARAGTSTRRAGAARTGSIRARGNQSGRVAVLSDVRDAINSAVADGEKVRQAIENRIDRALRLPRQTRRKGGRSARR